MSADAFGVYVHWPFCLAKCPYCDFNSHVRHGGVDQSELRRCLSCGARAFRGAGAGPHRLKHLLRRRHAIADGARDRRRHPRPHRRRFGRSRPDAEITLEANPTSVEAGRFRGYRAAGVNRVSLGVQSLDDASLKSLGRKHTSDEALAALAIANRNFERVSFDLIYARQGQALSAWREELASALTHAQDHLSLYQLTIEEGTPFAALHAAGALTVPKGAKAEAFYLLTQELCDAAGLPSYEVSNHARPGSRVAAQSALLARPRLCRRRPGRP